MEAKILYGEKLSEQEIAVFSCLAYFDIFNHPLKCEEIIDFCGVSIDAVQALSSLDKLIGKSLVSKKDDYYFLNSAALSNCEKRILANQNALLKEAKVRKYAKLIAKFPFVQGLCISGSFSKGLLESDGDIDYFIITRPDRLWICRTLLIAFKKIFLFNSHKYFCVNYFVDSANLNIPDKNIFVATEIKTLLPTYNSFLFKHFLTSNDWTNEYLPNKKETNYSFCSDEIRKPVISNLISKTLNSSLGDRIDNFCFKLTLKRWKMKFPDFSINDFDLNLRSRKNVSKHHPRGFQKKVLEAYKEKLNILKDHS